MPRPKRFGIDNKHNDRHKGISMVLPEDHEAIEVESFQIPGATGASGKVYVRPVPGQKFPVKLFVEGNKSLAMDYAVGTRFKAQVSLMDRASGGQYLFSSWQWDVKVLSTPEPG
jgi:hypothetical protein